MAKIDGINSRTGEILNIKSSIDDINVEPSIITSSILRSRTKSAHIRKLTRKVEEKLDEAVKTQELIGLLDRVEGI